MAQYVIPIRNEDLKDEIDACFDAKFSDATGTPLTPEEKVILHVSNYIRGVLNEYRAEQARLAAEAAVEKEDSLL